MNPKKRAFLKILGKGVVVLGGGLLGVPLGCRRDGAYLDLLDAAGELVGPDGRLLVDGDRVREMTEEERRDFAAQVDAAAESRTPDAGGPETPPDAPAHPIPPGQHVVEGFTLYGSNPAPRPLDQWRFHVTGAVDQEVSLPWEAFAALPTVDRVRDFHCVTGWTVLDVEWRGVPFKDLLALAGVRPDARFVFSDTEPGYGTSISLDYASRDDVLVATHLFGQALDPAHGGPTRGVVPDKYGYKSAKWLSGLRVLVDDELGFWESVGYSNTADPWSQDRWS